MTGFHGRYNDGKSAVSRRVTLKLQFESLWILDEGGKLLADWPYQTIQPVDELVTAKTLRLRCDSDAESRLLVDDPELLEELATYAPQFRRGVRAARRTLRRVSVAVVGALAVLTVFWIVLPKGVVFLARVIPVSWEQALGKASLDDALDLFGIMDGHEPRICDGPQGRAALTRLVGRFEDSINSPYDFEVIVVDIGITNAFALPGGYVVLFEGLIDSSGAADEVAGVLAHEMGHVIHRHGTEGLLRQMGLSLVFDFMMGDLGGSIGGQVGSAMLSLSYSREAESDADRTGVEILQSSGVRPGGMATFFKRLQKEHGDVSGPWEILSTHPSLAARLEQLEEVENVGEPAMNDADWQALQSICGDSAEDEPDATST